MRALGARGEGCQSALIWLGTALVHDRASWNLYGFFSIKLRTKRHMIKTQADPRRRAAGAKSLGLSCSLLGAPPGPPLCHMIATTSGHSLRRSSAGRRHPPQARSAESRRAQLARRVSSAPAAMALPRRVLGNTGLEVSVLGFGASPLGSVFEVGGESGHGAAAARCARSPGGAGPVQRWGRSSTGSGTHACLAGAATCCSRLAGAWGQEGRPADARCGRKRGGSMPGGTVVQRSWTLVCWVSTSACLRAARALESCTL